MNQKILKQSQKVAEIASELSKQQAKLLELQRNELTSIKTRVTQKYLKKFQSKPLYKFDQELISVIFYLANMEVDDNPKIDINFDRIKYYNNRLEEWRIL